jgi:outer membrane protein assembly factor BamD (BamD/ComL family)
LGETQELLVRTSGDLLRRYLVRHTTYDDYDSINKSAYLYSLGKDLLLKGEAQKAVGYLNGVSSRSRLWPFVLQLRGTAQAILGKTDEAIRDFRSCHDRADSYVVDSSRSNQSKEAADLSARCKASEARTLYQVGRFEDADRTYDAIPKGSLVWPDILFEQAWNGFAKQEYNKALGKLVSYKSPALEFVFNSEVDVLRAQSYLALCLYSDANDVINEFNTKYTGLGVEVKRFVENRSSNLKDFYDLGKQVLRNKLHTKNDMHRMVNRFIRGPYFQNLVEAESAIGREVAKIRQYETGSSQAGFAGFLNLVLNFRVRSIHSLGGAFVKNSLMDYHRVLISDFEKMAFIKLEMLGRAKEKLVSTKPKASGSRNRGNIEPARRDDQYRWGFNGEFWADELGDYVFGLESECS